MRNYLVVGLLVLVSAAEAAEPAASLSFRRGGQEVARLTVAQMSAKVKPVQVKFFDPHHGKTKAYRCWPIKEVLEAAYGPGWSRPPYTEAVLTASDGYASQSEAGKLREDGGCLAFEDLDTRGAGWEPIGRKAADPGPFYLVWTSAEQSTENGYPWPYQLASVDLIRFEDRYPEVVPRGADPASAEYRGFETFKTLCMRCHAINQQGGKVGPDLNAPQSVTAYRTKKWIKSYIRAPSKVRYTEMPDHPGLSDRDLDDLYRYFKLKAKQPEKPWK